MRRVTYQELIELVVAVVFIATAYYVLVLY